MSSAAAAIAWEFRRRHRWGFLAVLFYFVVLLVLRLFVEQRVNFEDAENFAWAVIVPMTATFIYFLAVFTFGLSGDIASRQSMYPARMFTLPVTPDALAAWPMLYGSIP